MKKLIALLLAAAMLLSLTACGGSAEPAETTPATTETAVVETEAPTEAPTEEPTEAPTEPRVAPVDFEEVDPATLPEPIPVEEQLQSEDTQTVTLGSLEEYEDLLWSLGFKEVRLTGTHEALVHASGNSYVRATAYCEPVSLTYNNNAFRFDFTYCATKDTGETVKEDCWFMYGTKSTSMANVSPMDSDEFYDSNASSASPFVITFDGTGFSSDEEALAAALESLQAGQLEGNKTEIDVNSPNYEEEIGHFGLIADESNQFETKNVYYPVTGKLYNYMRDPNSEGIQFTIILNGAEAYQMTVGYAARTMCFHYLFPAEDAAE